MKKKKDTTYELVQAPFWCNLFHKWSTWRREQTRVWAYDEKRGKKYFTWYTRQQKYCLRCGLKELN